MANNSKPKPHKKKEASPPRILIATRYLVLIPIIGLALAAAMLFLFGGIKLVELIIETTMNFLGLTEGHETSLPVYVEIVEYVHTFLIGTVLYLTSIGFFQLFIKKMNFPRWLRVRNTEELETNLIGVTVVVLAINFMSLSFNKNGDFIIRYGIGVALPIAALGLFLGMRSWAKKMETDSEDKDIKMEVEIELLKRQIAEMQQEKESQK